MALSEIRTEVCEILNEIMPNKVYLQGSMSDNEDYPTSFLTYLIDAEGDSNFADNDAWLQNFSVNVAIYSKDINVVDEKADEIYHKMKQHGYTYQGGGDAMSDEKTHTGFVQSFEKIK